MATTPFSVCKEFCAGGGGASDAKNVKYDNKKSGLAADNVGDAIDEVCGKMGDIDTSKNWNQNDPKEVDYIENRPFYEDGTKVKQLEDKFIPNTIARTADVDKKMNEAEANVDAKIIDARIKPTANGSMHTLPDSAEAPLQGMRIFGKTKQATTTGKNKLPYMGYRSKNNNPNGLTYTENEDESITISGTTTGYSMYYLCETNIFENGKQYAIPKFGDGNIILYVNYLDAEGKSCYEYHFKSFVWSSEYTFKAIYLQVHNKTVNETIYPIIVEGSTYDGNWEPYTGGMPSPSFSYKQDMKNDGDKGSIELFVMGGNLFGIDSSTIEPVNYVDKQGTKNTRNGRALRLPAGSYKASCKRISTNSGYENLYIYFCINDSSGRFVSSDYICAGQTVFSPTITIRDGEVLYIYDANAKTTVNASLSMFNDLEIQLEAGTVATPYEPPNHQSLTIPTPNGLGGIPDIEAYDYIDLARGVRVQSTYDFIANGTEDWSILEHSGNALRQFYVYTDSGNGRPRSRYVSDKISCICNYYRAIDINSRQYNPYTAYIGLQSICVHDPDYLTVPAWKARLAELYANGTPLIIKYALETPNETPLSEEEIAAYKALHTNYPNTTIYNDEGAYTEVKYVADTKNYVDNKIANEVAKLTAAIITE